MSEKKVKDFAFARLITRKNIMYKSTTVTD